MDSTAEGGSMEKELPTLKHVSLKHGATGGRTAHDALADFPHLAELGLAPSSVPRATGGRSAHDALADFPQLADFGYAPSAMPARASVGSGRVSGYYAAHYPSADPTPSHKADQDGWDLVDHTLTLTLGQTCAMATN